MRSPVILGAGAALAVGVLILAGILAGVTARQPLAPPATASPGGSAGAPLGLYTPPPTAPPSVTPSPEITLPVGTQVGHRAPQLVLPGLDGTTVNTADYAGQPMWINFMATWCLACRDELPMMRRIHVDMREEAEANADEGEEVELPLQIIFVDSVEPEPRVADFMAEFNIDLPTALDLDGAVQRQWGAYALPVHFFIDEQGIVQEVVFGGAPEEIFEAAIGTIVPNFALVPGDPAEGDPGVEP